MLQAAIWGFASRTVGHDLVHDDACGASAEIRIPLDISGKLCIRKEKGVVEDGTTLRDTECLVVVDGDIIAVGACDLYERNPVCRLRHIGTLRLGSGGVGDDVGDGKRDSSRTDRTPRRQ